MRGDRIRADVGAVSIGVVLALAGLVGTGIGMGLALTGAVDVIPDEETTRGQTLAIVDAFACPGTTEAVSSFTQGDRLYVTALDPTGEYARVRDPRDGDNVWVPLAALELDSEPIGLPMADCSEDGPIALVVATTTASTTTTTSSSTTTTTTVPDTSGPEISNVVISSAVIAPDTCPGDAVSVSATVTDASAITSLTVRWRYLDTPNFPEGATQVAVTVDGTAMSAVIDGISDPWPGAIPPYPDHVTDIEIRIRSVDEFGNATAVFRTIVLDRC